MQYPFLYTRRLSVSRSFYARHLQMLFYWEAVSANLSVPNTNVPLHDTMLTHSYFLLPVCLPQYAVAVDELVLTVIVGVVAVTGITFLFMPHWTAPLLVFPLIAMLYINMLGTIGCLGLHINGLTYVYIVVAIGLLIDFLIHVLLRFYECSPGKTRDKRVKETLETMGVSVLIGGVTTFLAVVPLAASSVKVFMTVFKAFFAMIILGCTHGMILLPVVLSLVGPTTNVRHTKNKTPTSNTKEDSRELSRESPSSSTALVLGSVDDFCSPDSPSVRRIMKELSESEYTIDTDVTDE